MNMSQLRVVVELLDQDVDGHPVSAVEVETRRVAYYSAMLCFQCWSASWYSFLLLCALLDHGSIP